MKRFRGSLLFGISTSSLVFPPLLLPPSVPCHDHLPIYNSRKGDDGPRQEQHRHRQIPFTRQDVRRTLLTSCPRYCNHLPFPVNPHLLLVPVAVPVRMPLFVGGLVATAGAAAVSPGGRRRGSMRIATAVCRRTLNIKTAARHQVVEARWQNKKRGILGGHPPGKET